MLPLFPWWIKYPNVNNEIQNLDWLLYTVKHLAEEVKNFINLNTIKYADPILWDITSQYEANTVVIDPQSGDAYISTKAVPYGVILSNTDYWTKIYNYTQSLNKLQEQIAAVNEELSPTATGPRTVGQLVWLNGLLYRVTSTMIAGDTYVEGSNCEKTTIEEELHLLFDSIVGNLEDLDTSDKSNIVAALNEVRSYAMRATNYIFYPENYGAAGDGITDDAVAIQNMINAMTPGSTAVFSSPNGYYVGQTINVNKSSLVFTSGYGELEATRDIKTDAAITIFNVTSYGVCFQNLNFHQRSDAYRNATAISFTGNVDGDTDGTVYNCTVGFFDIGIHLRGKNIRVENCHFSHCDTAVQIDPTIIDTENRGYEILNNRFHSCDMAIRNNINKETRYRIACVIANNFASFTDVFYYGYNGVVIKGNTSMHTGTNQHLRGRGIFINDSLADYICEISENYFETMVASNNYRGIEYNSVNGIANIHDNDIVGFNDYGIWHESGKAITKNNFIRGGSFGVVISGSATGGVCEGNVGTDIANSMINPTPPATVTISNNITI